MIDKEAAEAAFEPYRFWLVQRRLALDLSKTTVSRLLGLRRPHKLTAYELGLTVPTLQSIVAWHDVLEADLVPVIRRTPK